MFDVEKETRAEDWMTWKGEVKIIKLLFYFWLEIVLVTNR